MKNLKSKKSNTCLTEERFGEKCGIIGVWCSEKIAPYYVKKGLSALQHRGQESAGISILKENNEIKTHTGLGLVPNVLTYEVIKNLGGSITAIGHNRYSTSGSINACNAQPITLSHGKHTLTIGHNGNIPDIEFLGESIGDGHTDEQSSDTALIAKILLRERDNYPDWDSTLKKTLPRINGAFCLVIMTNDGTLYGARDPYGIRPFCLGKLETGWIIASESVAIDVNGGEFIRDIKPGEIIKIAKDGSISSMFFGPARKQQNCIFEYIYFSRPDSFENGIRVRSAREKAGFLLGKRIAAKGIKADAIVPVFDSGYPSAKGVALALGLPLIDAITVSHYIGRTFIQPGQENRLAAVIGKHNIVPDEIVGKRIIVVDDSAVRLTTSRRLYAGLKEARAKEVYMVFSSPPVVNQCDLGIDMKSKKELPASKWENEPFEVIEKNISDLIGADGVVYLPIEELTKALGKPKEDFYHYPFGGTHPIKDKQYEFPQMKKNIKSKPGIMVMISGSGTNLEQIIEQVNNGSIEAEIISVVSNKKDALGLEKAKNQNIPAISIEYTGKFSDKIARNEYDLKLVDHVKKTKPDIIVLAGWMMILGDTFLEKINEMEIPVINLHPALLTDNTHKTITTSRGTIPVIRGAHAIRSAYDLNLPVSGVTAHLVLPGNHYDAGPVILKEEVRIRQSETLEQFEKNMHEAEYRVLPTAIRRVIHLLKQNLAVTKGKISW